jgi:long-chain fatty acid transport protein
MKKHLIVAVLVLCIVPASFATLVTNMNQSAMYLRLLSRNASTDVDAVYYNPAGLTSLKDGWHIGLNNQTVLQTKTVKNEFPLLNNGTYDGKVNVPFFPDLFLAYKKGPLALSFGFGPAAGGGTADFTRGLPSFEWQFATLPGLISGMGIPTTKYSADIAFKGSSIYLGFQFNVSYAFNDMISGAIGARYISATNTYTGHIQNVMVNPNFPPYGFTGTMVKGTVFFTTVGQPAYAAMAGDKSVDAKQTASGFAPIISLNFTPMAGLNVSAKYEFQTKLEFTNATTVDDTGLFPNGATERGDIPAFLSLGAEWMVLPELKATASFNYFFDKNANWAGREAFVNSNSFDLAVGFEYALSNMFLLSAGYLHTQFDLAPGYQSDLAHDMGADTFGGGFRIKLSPAFDIDLSAMNVGYKTDQKSITYLTSTGANLGAYLEHYSRKTFAFALALNFHL